MRNRAYHAAYTSVTNVMIVVIGGAMLLFLTGLEVGPKWLSHPTGHAAAITGFGLATLQLFSLLPTSIVAWTEGDEPGDSD